MNQSKVAARNRRILEMLREGMAPRNVAKKLRLSNVMQVYYATRKIRKNSGRNRWAYLGKVCPHCSAVLAC